MTNIRVYSCGGALFLKKKNMNVEKIIGIVLILYKVRIFNMKYRYFTRLKIYGNKNWVSAAVSSKRPEVGLGAAKFQ